MEKGGFELAPAPILKWAINGAHRWTSSLGDSSRSRNCGRVPRRFPTFVWRDRFSISQACASSLEKVAEKRAITIRASSRIHCTALSNPVPPIIVARFLGGVFELSTYGGPPPSLTACCPIVSYTGVANICGDFLIMKSRYSRWKTLRKKKGGEAKSGC